MGMGGIDISVCGYVAKGICDTCEVPHGVIAVGCHIAERICHGGAVSHCIVGVAGGGTVWVGHGGTVSHCIVGIAGGGAERVGNGCEVTHRVISVGGGPVARVCSRYVAVRRDHGRAHPICIVGIGGLVSERIGNRHQVSVGVISVGGGGACWICHGAAFTESVVGIAGGVAVWVGRGGEIPVSVVGVGGGCTERVYGTQRFVEGVVGVCGCLTEGVGGGGEIPVSVVAIGGGGTERVGLYGGGETCWVDAVLPGGSLRGTVSSGDRGHGAIYVVLQGLRAIGECDEGGTARRGEGVPAVGPGGCPPERIGLGDGATGGVICGRSGRTVRIGHGGEQVG